MEGLRPDRERGKRSRGQRIMTREDSILYAYGGWSAEAILLRRFED